MTAQLSKGFFYFCFLDEVPNGYVPILQILETKPLRDGSHRLRMFDGLLRYSDCFATAACWNLNSVEPLSIVKVNKFSIREGKKPQFQLDEVETLQLNVPSPTEFIHYQGDPDSVSEEIKKRNIKLEVQAVNKRTRLNPDAISPLKTNAADVSLPNNPRRKQTQHNRSVLPDGNVTPIGCLTPFINKWRICGVCTSRESVREVTGAKGPLRVMSFELTDEKGHSVKVVGWNEMADVANTQVSEGDCYYVSGEGCIRKKNAKFNSTENEYEISLNQNCQISLCTDRSITKPQFNIKRVKISDIPKFWELNNQASVDVLAVVDKIGEVQPVFSQKKNVELSKREITLVDESKSSVVVVLWEDQAENLLFNVAEAVALKNFAIKEFNGGFTLARANDSKMVTNPDLTDVIGLYGWYESNMNPLEITPISSSGTGFANVERDVRTLNVIKASNMAATEGKGAVFYTFVRVTEIRKETQISYQACVSCNKKVQQSGNGYDCEKCNKRGNAEFKRRFMLSLQIADATDMVYVTAFDDQAKELLGRTADEMEYLANENRTAYDEVFNDLYTKAYMVKLKVNQEFYNDMNRVKYTLMNVKLANFTLYERILDANLSFLEDLSMN